MGCIKICDGCGEKIIGKSYPAYNENHVKQRGINYCMKCAFGPLEEVQEEIICSIRPFDCEHYVHEHKCGLIKTDCKYAKHIKTEIHDNELNVGMFVHDGINNLTERIVHPSIKSKE